MKILQADSFPLLGKRLIEASAGTGKTYTIANLYLRLLLADFQLEKTRDLALQPVDRILVVTFTRAATEELRGRIRDRIRDLYEDVLRLKQDPEDNNGQIDPYIKALIARTEDNFYSEKEPKKLLLTDWLQANLAQMDESSVFTIHGFCQRILKQFAFDSGVGFESEMILDAQDYLRRAAQDYWRELAYPMDQEQLSALLGQISSPEDVFWKVRGWLQHDDIELLPKAKAGMDFSTAWQAAKAGYESAAAVWQEFSIQDVNDLIENSGVDKRSFSKTTRPKRIAAAKDFFNELTSFNGSIPKDVLELGQENLFSKTKKGEAPEHKAFRLIDQLAAECEQMTAVLPHHMLAQVKEKFWASMESANLMNPDDLLRLLANALRGSHGALLADHIRRQYPFAMIDEFQDTDSLQYDIFNQVYHTEEGAEENSGLYMIGDPKQAIYSFRGADIFTYLQAGRSLNEESRFTLNTNWRSHSNLVSATNALFSRHPEPFVLPGKIEFQPVLAAGNSDDGYFHYRGQEKCAPLNILLNSEGTNRDGGRYNAAEMCSKSIQQLLLKSCLKEKAVTAGDIAVLVHNRKQAKLVKDNLKQLGINSVFLSRDSVLNSIEARDVLRWLTAIAEPQNERLLRNALACESLNYSAEYLASLLEDEIRWEAELAQLYSLRDRFNQRGVMAFLMAWLDMKPCMPRDRELDQAEPFAVRLRKQVDGERKLTNFLHLGEVLQQASRELGVQSGFYNTDGKGLLTLLRWYSDRCQNALLNQSEEQQIRLESDANLVQIVTIHKSKGLQYPVVFLPFCWDEDNNTVKFDALYHTDKIDSDSDINRNRNNKTRSVLTINTKPNKDAKDKHVAEVRAEAMRLLYVALTRAEQACFVQLENVVKQLKAGPKGLLMNSAIGYLLAQDSVSIDGLTERFSDVIDAGDMSLSYYGDWLEGLEATPALPQRCKQVNTTLEAAQFHGKVWDNWRLTSYSQLAKLDNDYVPTENHTAIKVNSSDLSLDVDSHFDTEADFDVNNSVIDSIVDDEKETDNNLTVFDFPKGATPGTCLHGVLENWDFVDHQQLTEQVEQQLKFYGISEEFNLLLVEWMQQVVAQPLTEAGCSLSQVSENNRLVEMEFYLPMTEIRASGVMPLLNGRRLAFEPMRGQLKGFIDLIFRHDGRYYVADYKSNYLGDQISDYQPAALVEAMEHHQYDLQYWIYSIAVDQYLSRRIPNYDYETHFGGVYYFFLRGMNGKADGEGVFFTRPEKSQLEKWRRWLLADNCFGTEEQSVQKQAVQKQTVQNSMDDDQQLGLF